MSHIKVCDSVFVFMVHAAETWSKTQLFLALSRLRDPQGMLCGSFSISSALRRELLQGKSFLQSMAVA